MDMNDRNHEILNWRQNKEELFYDGFMHEGCFLLACQECFGDDHFIINSNAKEDKQGIDFKLMSKKGYKGLVDVTISIDSFAQKLDPNSKSKSIPILLPIHNPNTQKSYVELFLENPNLEEFQEYLEHIHSHNHRILSNGITNRLNIDIIKGKNGRKGSLNRTRQNGNSSYSIELEKKRYYQITNLLSNLKKFTL